MPTLYNLNLTIKDTDYDLTTGLLAQLLPTGWQEITKPTGETDLKLYSHDPKELDQIKTTLEELITPLALSTSSLAEENWFTAWQENFKPIICGEHFVILPPWLEEEQSQFEPKIPIIIEPKNAFGTGQHETTALCLTMLSSLYDQQKLDPKSYFLDLGTGSGILAIACAKLGLKGLAIDNDPDAIQNTQENSRRNQVEDKITPILGSIDAVAEQKFDLILANILANPLIAMSQSIVGCLKQPGHLILSGLLNIQADNVSAAYQKLGLPKEVRQELGEWSALYFTK